jgi:GT2 family glycosyltransferase
MSASARTTIVMTARERHDLAVSALQSVVDNTPRPYRLVYVDSGSPPWLGEILAQRAGEWGVEICRAEPGLWPNQIRKQIAPSIDTEYVVFMDNDVSVRPHWLERLVACADETGAGIVGPLVLIGSGSAGGKIHMAGGRLRTTPAAGGRVLEEWHSYADRNPEDVRGELERGPSDFLEYHCLLMRTKLAKEVLPFDDRIVCVHEHIDTALAARKAGYTLYFEPSVEVTYLAYNAYKLEGLPFFRARWGRAASEASIQAFCAKWNVIDDERSFGGVRAFLERHRGTFDPIRVGAVLGPEQRRPMAPQELRQTLSGLGELAASRGYRADEWATVEQAYRAAMILMNGAFRPCGRPFINHVAGTASVLMHYELNHGVVAAGLLHAAYTHCPQWSDDPQQTVAKVADMLGGRGNPVEATVREYTRRMPRARELLQSPRRSSEITTGDAAVLAIAAANEADMHLSGEFRFSGRRDVEPPEISALVPMACAALGISGLADTLDQERRKLAAIPTSPAAAAAPASFRLEGERMRPAMNASVSAAVEQGAPVG